MSDIQSTVGELVAKLHTNIDHINQIIQSLSDKSYNRKLEQLAIQRESAIHSLREKRVDALKQILAQRTLEKEETSKKRARERQLVEERRIEEWQEILARRKIEDEKWLQAIEVEDQEIEKSRSYEDEEREREREEEERVLFEKSENEIERMENEMEKSLEEGRITLKKLDEDRKIINAQIEAALSAPTVIPNLSFKSRRQKSRDLSHDQLENPRNASNVEIPDASLAITSLENSEVENSSFCAAEFEKSISDGKSSTRSSTSSSTEPKELRLVSLMQKEMSGEAIRKRESVFSQKTNSSRGSPNSVDLTKRLSTWRIMSEVISKDLELSGVPAQDALASEEHTNNSLSLFPIKYVHNKTNSRIARSKSIDEKSKISYPINLKKKITKANSESSVFVGQTSHDNNDDRISHNNDECQISPSNDESKISYAKESGTELNNSYCEASQINDKPIVLQKILVNSTGIPAKQGNQIGEHDFYVAGISEQEDLIQQLQTANESKLNSPSQNNFKFLKNSPTKFPASPEESVKETNSIPSGLLSRNIVNSMELTTEILNKMETSSKLDYSQEHDDYISALKLAPDSIAIKDVPHSIANTTSLKEGETKQLGLVSRLHNRVLDAESDSNPENSVLHGSATTTPIKSGISSSDDGDGSSSTDIDILNSTPPDLFEYEVEKTEEIISESTNNYLPKSPQLSEKNLSLNNASLSESESEIEKNLMNNISDISPLTEINEQKFVSETSSYMSQSFKEEIIDSGLERKATNEIGEVDCDVPHSHQVLTKYPNPENVTESKSTENNLHDDFDEEDFIDASEHIISTQHMSSKEIDVLEEFNNQPAISSNDHFSLDSIEQNDLCQIEMDSDLLTTSLEQENKQSAPVDVKILDNSSITGSTTVIRSSSAQDSHKLITPKTTDLIEEEESTNRQESESNSPQIHNQGATSKFAMLPSDMRYKRSISRDIAALKYMNAGHNMQSNYLSNSQPSTALTTYTDITTVANITKYKKQISEICSDEHAKNCQIDLTIEENPELEKFDLKDDPDDCSVIDQEQDNKLTNERVESQKEICNNQQKISLISDVDDLSNHMSSVRKSPYESPSHAYVLPKEHDQMSTTSSILPVLELESPQLGEATSDDIADLENTQKIKVNHDTSTMTNKSNEDVLTQGPEHGDLNVRRYSNSSDITFSSDAGHSTDKTPKKCQFTYTYNEKEIANIDESKASELNNELASSNLEVKEVEEEHLPEKLNLTHNIEDSILPGKILFYFPNVDLNKLTRRFSYDSGIGRDKLKELGTELVTKETKFIDNKTEQINVPLSRSLSENDLTKMTKEYLDKDTINSHRISSTVSNDTTTKEEITFNTKHQSSPTFKHSISTSSPEKLLSPRVGISNTESIASSRQAFYNDDSKDDDQEIKNLTGITDSEDELCNSHLCTDSNISHDPRNSLVDQANNEYQHEISIKPSIQPLKNSEALTPTDTSESDQASSVSTTSFFQMARALFDNQQQPRVENHKPVAKRVRPLSGLFKLRGGMLSSKQRFDNNILAISEDEETNYNVPTSSIENSVGINRSYSSMSYAESSKPLRSTAKQRYHRTEQSRLSFYEGLQRAASASASVSNSPIHSPVYI